VSWAGLRSIFSVVTSACRVRPARSGRNASHGVRAAVARGRQSTVDGRRPRAPHGPRPSGNIDVCLGGVRNSARGSRPCPTRDPGRARVRLPALNSYVPAPSNANSAASVLPIAGAIC
jgi:hypothetical protein